MLSPHRQPDGMPLDEWQRPLREEFGKAQPFHLSVLAGEGIPSDNRVDNPVRGTSYTVNLRGPNQGGPNQGGASRDRCTCPDFRTSGLDTCKHIAFARQHWERQLGKRAWRLLVSAPIAPVFSEIVQDRAGDRRSRFLPAVVVPPELEAVVRKVCAPDGF